ncbi:FGGY family carbohydrate kinase [Mycolicibacterium phlei]|uniref:FGGY family carbohydrate kinase n=1 Tax=Mycolicibacterium phlei TaxID=1771 RepID=UPI003F49A2B9
MELLLGIDMGTGSTKGVLVDTSGSVVASETIPHSMDLPRPGWAEVDPDAVWWQEVCTISRVLTAQVPSGDRVGAMCVSGVGPCLVLCDSDLRPLRPAILYGIDTRATAEIESLTEEFGEQNILDLAGTPLSSQAVGPKIEWVRRNEPDVFEQSRGWYGSNSYIAAKLTGEYVMDHHTASQCDPMYITREFDWNLQWAKRICGHLPLPRLAWPPEGVGTRKKKKKKGAKRVRPPRASAAPGLAPRGGRHRHRRRGRRDRGPGGHPGDRRRRRRVFRGVLGRCARAR